MRGPSVLSYAVKRILWILPVLLAASIITFVVMHAAPGSPWNREGRQLRPEIVERLNEELGLDKPLPVQYVAWLGSVVRGDFGLSTTPFRSNVNDVIGEAMWPTIQLWFMALAVALVGRRAARRDRGVAAPHAHGLARHRGRDARHGGARLRARRLPQAVARGAGLRPRPRAVPRRGLGRAGVLGAPHAGAGRPADRAGRPPHAREHARRDACRLRADRPQQGARRAADRDASHVPQCARAAHHDRRSAARGADHRLDRGRAGVPHPRHGAALLDRPPAAELRGGDGPHHHLRHRGRAHERDRRPRLRDHRPAHS